MTTGDVFVKMGGTTTGGLLASSDGWFVSTELSLLVSAGGFSVSRLQPSISMAVKLATLMASTQKTASFMRERRLCCSSNEPCGTNGFGLFMI